MQFSVKPLDKIRSVCEILNKVEAARWLPELLHSYRSLGKRLAQTRIVPDSAGVLLPLLGERLTTFHSILLSGRSGIALAA